MKRPAHRPCPHFGECGGCASFAADYPAEFEAKRAQVQAELRALLPAHEIAEIRPLQPAPARGPRGFRARLLWPIQPGRGRKLRGGLYRTGSHELVEPERCEVQTPELFALAKEILGIAEEIGVPGYDERTGEGFLRALDLRHLPLRGEALVTLVTRGGVWEDGPELARRIRAAGSRIATRSRAGFRVAGVVRSINDEEGNRVLGPRFVPLLGRDHLIDDVHGLQLRVSAGSFYQSNWRAEPLLFAPALAMLGALPGRRVLDLFSGVGAFGLRAARAGASDVQLIESHELAVRDARENVRRNGLESSTRVRLADASLPEVLRDLAADIVILDPPRKGMGPDAAAALRDLDAEQILYVSCFPKSLARDLDVLLAGPWRLRDLASADLFPRSRHLELVALLGRR